jgi:hypothetical protein
MRTIQAECAKYSGGQSMRTTQVDRVCELFRLTEYANYSGGQSILTI